MKTSELIAPALDWAVGVAEGKNVVLHDDGVTRCIVVASASGVYKGTFYPSISWAQGGPIIERDKIAAEPWVCRLGNWRAIFTTQDNKELHQYGPTPLIAAMRCFVASKLGDAVEVPEELL